MTSFIPIENVKFDKKLTEIEQHAGGVVLRFADGEVAEASVVAGADGIKSTVREHVLSTTNPSQVDPVYANAYCYRGVIPMAEAKEIFGDLTDVAKFYFGYKRGAVTYRISGGEVSRRGLFSVSAIAYQLCQEFNFLLCVASDKAWPSQDAVTEEITMREMLSEFQGEGVDDRFRQLLVKAKPIRWGFFHHLHTSTYCRDRVALLGDSAHASLPFQAAGAAQGVEDALVLSNVLAELANVPRDDASLNPKIVAGLAAYDSVRRPRAQFQLEQSEEVARMLFLQHEEAGSDMGKILPKLQNGRFNWLWFHDVEGDVKTALSRITEARFA